MNFGCHTCGTVCTDVDEVDGDFVHRRCGCAFVEVLDETDPASFLQFQAAHAPEPVPSPSVSSRRQQGRPGRLRGRVPAAAADGAPHEVPPFVAAMQAMLRGVFSFGGLSPPESGHADDEVDEEDEDAATGVQAPGGAAAGPGAASGPRVLTDDLSNPSSRASSEPVDIAGRAASGPGLAAPQTEHSQTTRRRSRRSRDAPMGDAPNPNPAAFWAAHAPPPMFGQGMAPPTAGAAPPQPPPFFFPFPGMVPMGHTTTWTQVQGPGPTGGAFRPPPHLGTLFGGLMGGMVQGFGGGNGDGAPASLEDFLHQLLVSYDGPVGTPPTAAAAVEGLRREAVPPDVASGGVECPVCFDEFRAGAESVVLPCSHRFDPDCILPWLREHSSCPTCRYQLPTDDAEYNQRAGILSQ
eukprot:TRINITY_DN8956_c0_g1_i1.p1 TRINITY_DN8956_c0_g1~~TRINITY_DN8956_c0_g1_i1.p1  ORF type:complete len:442 (+),score=51.45 TRINITY_DN8956_c0_g1_i1:103-1326(+)